MRSVDDMRNDLWECNVPPENADWIVRAQVIRGYNYVEHIDDESCWFHGMININPNFSFVPDWFLNFIVKRAVYVMIGKVQSKEVFENELLTKRIEERKEFYQNIKKRIEDLIQDEGATDANVD